MTGKRKREVKVEEKQSRGF